MRDIDVAPLPLSHLESHLDEVAIKRLHTSLTGAEALLEGRTVWTVTPSAAAGSGPAETVAPLVGYSLGAGLNVRWLTLDAPEEFTRIAARLHAGIHGDHGDGGKLGDKQRDIYEHVLASNAENIVEEVRPDDIVILHDPPTAGLAKALKAAGATVIWRCHAGAEGAGEAADYAWAFLDRYLEDVDLVIVSRPEYRPPYIEAERCAVLAPSIDADSPKNRVLDLDEAWSVARLSGIFAGEPPFEAVPFMRHTGAPTPSAAWPTTRSWPVVRCRWVPGSSPRSTAGTASRAAWSWWRPSPRTSPCCPRTPTCCWSARPRTVPSRRPPSPRSWSAARCCRNRSPRGSTWPR